MIELRDYQAGGVDGVRNAYSEGHRNVVFVLSTGGGKSFVFCYIAQSAAAKGRRVLILVHRRELLDQAGKSLDAMGVRHGVIAAGRSMDLSASVQVGSVDTVRRRLDKLPADLFGLVIADEAHHVLASTWLEVLGHFSAARVLGVTATPIRGDGKGLGDVFSAMVKGPSSQWLTDNGFLAPARVFSPPVGFDASVVGKRMGDFNMKQAEDQFAKADVMGDTVSHYRQHLDGKTAILFGCTVAHAEAEARALCRAGVRAASIDGKMDVSQRRDLLAALGAGDIKVLTSCSLIGEGVDVPSVAGCIMRRPTYSLGLYLQMVGRALRPQDGKVAVVLDHVGNVARHGHHLEPHDWSLEGAGKRDKDRAPSVKVCKKCFANNASLARVCVECGEEFPAAEMRDLEVVDGVLEEYRSLPPKPVFKAERSQAQTLEQLIAVGQKRGMANPAGWARHVIAARSRGGRAAKAVYS